MVKKYDWYWSLWNFGDFVPAPIARLQVLTKSLTVGLTGTSYFTDNEKAGIYVLAVSWIIDFLLQGICLEERIDKDKNVPIVGLSIILILGSISLMIK